MVAKKKAAAKKRAAQQHAQAATSVPQSTSGSEDVSMDTNGHEYVASVLYVSTSCTLLTDYPPLAAIRAIPKPLVMHPPPKFHNRLLPRAWELSSPFRWI